MEPYEFQLLADAGIASRVRVSAGERKLAHRCHPPNGNSLSGGRCAGGGRSTSAARAAALTVASSDPWAIKRLPAPRTEEIHWRATEILRAARLPERGP